MENKNIKVTKLDDSSPEENSDKSKKKIFLNKAYKWASGTWIPNAEEEKEFLENGYKMIKQNNKNNPGALGEYLVRKKIKSLDKELVVDINQQIDCTTWLPGQKNLKPDLIVGNTVIEVKTLRYNNSEGKRGNQGTAVEKIDSIPRKYGGVYKNTNKKVLVILVADQQLEKVGKSWIEAFRENYHGNDDFFKGQIELCKKLKIRMVGFNDFSLKDLENDTYEDTTEEIVSNEINIKNIVKSLSGMTISKSKQSLSVNV